MLYTCITQCHWRTQLWEPGDAIDLPPHETAPGHFAPLDTQNTPADAPMPDAEARAEALPEAPSGGPARTARPRRTAAGRTRAETPAPAPAKPGRKARTPAPKAGPEPGPDAGAHPSGKGAWGVLLG